MLNYILCVPVMPCCFHSRVVMYEPASYGPPDKSAVPAANADEHALDGEIVSAHNRNLFKVHFMLIIVHLTVLQLSHCNACNRITQMHLTLRCG
jgi:hypothetical protein